jgi:hypothetical protein
VAQADGRRVLAELAPLLDAPDADFGHWEVPPERDGVGSLGYSVLGPVGEAFRAAVASGGWIQVGFAWRAWLQTDEGRRLRDEPSAIDTATIPQLERLLTAIVRSDRFSEGSLAGAFASGLLGRIARRAAALADDLPPKR